MKRKLISLTFFVISAIAGSAQELPPGTICDEVPFALFEGDQLVNNSLMDLAEGKILVITYMTPW